VPAPISHGPLGRNKTAEIVRPCSPINPSAATPFRTDSARDRGPCKPLNTADFGPDPSGAPGESIRHVRVSRLVVRAQRPYPALSSHKALPHVSGSSAQAAMLRRETGRLRGWERCVGWRSGDTAAADHMSFDSSRSRRSHESKINEQKERKRGPFSRCLAQKPFRIRGSSEKLFAHSESRAGFGKEKLSAGCITQYCNNVRPAEKGTSTWIALR
jgi:hypothetical protein